MIELDNISAGYGKNTVLQDVTLSIEKGRLTSLIGVNGCGKSTLLKAVLGMIPLSKGKIITDGEELEKMTRNGLSRKVAYLAQGKNTPDMTVAQMVLHGRFPYLGYPRRYSKQDHEIALSVMEQMGIKEYAHKSMGELSGGMRQNAYIAMALAQGTDYVLLDEPTTYLDISHQLELMKTLRALADEGKGIVAVMHDLPLAMTYSDKIALLDNGHILCCAEPGEICRKGIIEQIFGLAVVQGQNGKTYSYQYQV